MKQFIILWSGALLITFLAGYIRSGISEYYPITGTIGINEKKVSYKFDKSYSGSEPYELIIRSDNPDITGMVKWRKEKSAGWNSISLKKEEGILSAGIPKQEAGEKIEYFAEIYQADDKFVLPSEPVTLLFLGNVPGMISFLSFFTLFGGILLSTRTGLEYFNQNQKIKKLTLFTAAFFFLYTVAVTPLRKSYELDAINRKVVPIQSLYDLHSVVLLLIWIAGMIVLFKVKDPRKTALLFSIITIILFIYL